MSKCKELYTCTFQYYIIFVNLQVIRTPTKLYVIVFVDALLFFFMRRGFAILILTNCYPFLYKEIKSQGSTFIF